jgi:hypothetical protein
MNKRTFWGAVAALAALYAARMALKMAEDLRRYNRILSMSNEGTVQEEMPELMMQVMKGERQTVNEWVDFMKSAPKDLARYMRIEAM